jgi:hypothetical protein
MLKFKKWKFRRFVHFEVLFIDKYRYGESIFPRDVKFCPRTGNPPTAYQHLSLASSRTGRRWCGVQAKEIRKKYIRVSSETSFVFRETRNETSFVFRETDLSFREISFWSETSSFACFVIFKRNETVRFTCFVTFF